MIELKIQCDCGQKYKFDVEPVHGRMPFEVNCPVCGAHGTAKANELLFDIPISSMAPPPTKPRLAVAHAPAEPAPSYAPPVATIVHAPAPVAAAAPPPEVAWSDPGVDVDEHGRPRKFWLSLTGVALGAILGMLVWHLIYRTTGMRLGFMALVTGVLAGVAPQLIGYYRSKRMGLLAALCALLAIFGAQFLNARVQVDKFIDSAEAAGYEEEVTEAKAIVAAVPNGTEEEIRAWLAKSYSDDEEKVTPAEIEKEDVDELIKELPRKRDLAAGKISKSEYARDFRQTTEEVQSSGVFKIYLLIRTIGIFNIVNIVLGVGAAYLTAKGS